MGESRGVKIGAKSFRPPAYLPRGHKAAETQGYRPTCARTRLPAYRRLPVLFALPMKLSLHPKVSLRYRSVVRPHPLARFAVVHRTGSRRYRPLARQTRPGCGLR